MSAEVLITVIRQKWIRYVPNVHINYIVMNHVFMILKKDVVLNVIGTVLCQITYNLNEINKFE
jgi:hypothetical protein